VYVTRSALQLRLEALHQIVVLISGMEEKGPPGAADRFPSSSLLTSVRLQFLAGCFGLGTVGAAGLKRESVQLHHYQVPQARYRRPGRDRVPRRADACLLRMA